MGAYHTRKQEEWDQAIISNFCSMGFSHLSDQFEGRVAAQDLMKTRLSEVATRTKFSVSRDPSHIANVDETVYLVKFQIRGNTIVTQRNSVAHLGPGDFVLCSTSEPYKLELNDENYQAVLSVPEITMKEIFAQADDFIGVKMDRNQAPHSILSTVIQGVVSQGDDFPVPILQRMEANILDLLGTSLFAEATRSTQAVKSTKEVHLDEIKRVVSLNLDNPQLSVEFIARKLCISTRYLHMLFKSEGISVSRFIQQLRLQACAEALRHPSYSQLSTTDIALRWCFYDSSHFSRCFKSNFGTTPTRYRNNTDH